MLGHLRLQSYVMQFGGFHCFHWISSNDTTWRVPHATLHWILSNEMLQK